MDVQFEMSLRDIHTSTRALGSLNSKPLEVLALIENARIARERSYAPYSHFNVGAAGKFTNTEGQVGIFMGANQENAAYSPTFCAECVAIMAARNHGFHELHMMAVCGAPDSSVAAAIREKAAKDWVAPCGRCRQVMAETAHENCLVVLARDDNQVMGIRFSELFPLSFGPKNLGIVPSSYEP